MKIIFICSSMEPGKDGVGDYTRRLACELIRQGHFSTALSLNDKYIFDELNEVQCDEGTDLPVLRLPANWNLEKRLNHAKKYIDEFNPDWMSLQFVIFGYHPRGLPLGLAKKLAFLGTGRCWHIMFHEIWIGITKLSPFKHKIYGFFQRRIIKSIVNSLNPHLITTSNGLYKIILKKNSIDAEILPLFSNIPIAEKNIDFINLINEQLKIGSKSFKKNIIIGIFGSLYAQAKLDDTIKEQSVLAQKNNKNLIFISIGRIGEAGVKEFARLEEKFGSYVKFFRFGEQSPENVSRLFQMMDLGISCTPAEHIGKSGVYAAMRYHDLDLIIPKSNFVPEYDTDIKHYNALLFKKQPYEWAVSGIAKSYVNLIYRKNNEN